MTLDLFSQFAQPYFLGLPMIFPFLLLPFLLLLEPKMRWMTNRLLIVQLWVVKAFTKGTILPLSFPGHKWALMTSTLMIFIMSMNLIGLLPYTFTPTSQLSLNLGLAVPLWLATIIVGLYNQPLQSFAHLLPEGTPTPLIPALVIIETISLFIRPLALGVRLTANLTAGHLLMQLISMATLHANSEPLSIIMFSALILLTVLEIAVAAIQAYVFVLLLTLYLQENIDHHDNH